MAVLHPGHTCTSQNHRDVPLALAVGNTTCANSAMWCTHSVSTTRTVTPVSQHNHDHPFDVLCRWKTATSPWRADTRSHKCGELGSFLQGSHSVPIRTYALLVRSNERTLVDVINPLDQLEGVRGKSASHKRDPSRAPMSSESTRRTRLP